MDAIRRLGTAAATATALGLAAPAWGTVRLDGDVTLDYYVARVDGDGFEHVDAQFYAQRVVNDGPQRSGPLSLAGWLTPGPSASGAGTEIADLPIGQVPGHSSLRDVFGTTPAVDAAPGEYFAHVLLQDDRFAGAYEDARSLTPRLLWRGGLEAVGPLDVRPYAGGHSIAVDFRELRNNRVDSRFTNAIVLTLYATYGYGPASDGYVLCSTTVPGLYAGDWRYAPGFDCAPSAIPDGGYTLHLEVAEAGGRGGSSTLSGPDAEFHGGALSDGTCCVYVDGVVYAGGLGAGALLPLAGALLALVLRRRGAARRVSAGAATPG